ncbi:COX15/CtaA family protein [Myxococcota bacterium]|nr:COX15/CtaA family protein [Myxococcota bacterium]
MLGRLDRFQRFALLTTIATYLLILVGGLVRASGAGLGCPDWPKCFGLWIPPMRVEDVPAHIDPALFNVVKTWTEYVNRLLGVAVGILIFGTLVLAIRHYKRSPRVLWSSVAAFVFVIIEGWLGGLVVRSKLNPLMLTAHLVFAIFVVSLLLYATVSAFFPEGRPRIVLTPERKMLARLTLVVGIIALVQLGIGADLRGELQLIKEDAAAPARDAWFATAGFVAGLHKNFALVVALAVGGLAWFVHARAEPDRWIRGAVTTALVLVVAQGATGLGLANLAIPPVLQMLHLWFGTLLLGALTVTLLLAYRLDPREATAPSHG